MVIRKFACILFVYTREGCKYYLLYSLANGVFKVGQQIADILNPG